MKEWMEPINSELPLAKAFNRIISDLELLRIMTNPRIFSDSTDKEAPFRMQNYYLTVLWERWLHGVFNRLVEWANTISSYFDEYNGSWEYYALSHRLDFIKEYGSDDEDDYNPDDTIKTTSITHEQLKYHIIFYDLYHDCVDIVQDAKPDDLYPMISTLDAKSRFSVIDIFQKATNQPITSYILDKEGHLRPMTFADKELIKVTEMVTAMDNGQLIYTIAQIMESLTFELETIAKSDRAFSDNHYVLNAILNDATSILNLRLDKTRFYQSTTSKSTKRPAIMTSNYGRRKERKSDN